MTTEALETTTPEWNQDAYSKQLEQTNAPVETPSSLVVMSDNTELPEDDVVEETTTEEQQAPADDGEYEIIELDGRKYEVPVELKEAFLRQQDYTKKTQELAEFRHRMEQQSQQLQTLSQATEQERQIDAGLALVQAKVEQFKNVDWTAAIDQDPIGAQKAFMEYTQLQQHQITLQQAKQTLYHARVQEMQRSSQEQRKAGLSELARDIPNWGTDVAKQIAEYATKTLGMNERQVMSITDPKIIKSIYFAMEGTRQIHKETPKPTPKPTPTLSKGKVGTGINSSMSTDSWMKARSKQVDRK